MAIAVGCGRDGQNAAGRGPARTTLVSRDGTETGPIVLPSVRDPGLHHYGANVAVAGDGTRDIRVEIKSPAFSRHDRQNGNRYGDGGNDSRVYVNA